MQFLTQCHGPTSWRFCDFTRRPANITQPTSPHVWKCVRFDNLRQKFGVLSALWYEKVHFFQSPSHPQTSPHKTRVYVSVDVSSSWAFLWIVSSATWRNYVLLDVPVSSVLTITPSRFPAHLQRCIICHIGCPTQINRRRDMGDLIWSSEAVTWNFSNPETTLSTRRYSTSATRRLRPSPMRRGDRYRQQTGSICREIVWRLCLVFSRRKTSRTGG